MAKKEKNKGKFDVDSQVADRDIYNVAGDIHIYKHSEEDSPAFPSKLAKSKKIINLFIASPGDIADECRIVRAVCDDLNKSALLEPFGVFFQATGWEDAFPSPGRPQEIINELAEDCDIFICIFHKRFGSPTGKEESGTLEEFLNAYDSWKSRKKPHILFYFKEVKIRSMKDLKDPQLQKVLKLKETIYEDKILLFNEFSTPDEFREKIRDHLEKWLVESAKGWERVGDKIEKAYEEDKIFKNYLQSALNEHRQLPTKGFVTTLRVPIELERVYINMHVRIHAHDFPSTQVGRNRMEDKIREEGISSIDIKAAFDASKQHKIKDMIILGDPGSGKTTLLKYILVILIEGKSHEKLGLENNIIPFFAPLRELRNPDKEDFPNFIKRVCTLADYSITGDSFKKLLDDGRGLILLDGLDEVADEEMRHKTCKWIDKAKKRFANSRFVITSRYAGYMGRSRLEGSVVELSIKDFTIDEVREFLIKWFEAVETGLHLGEDEDKWRKKGRDEALTLFERISKSADIQRLAVNPLILQIIALVHRDRGTLPQRRVELYEECTNVLLEKWDMAKGLDVPLTAREARQILQPIALWLHRMDERRSAPMAEIKGVIKDHLEEIGKQDIDPGKLLLNIRDRSGIFMGYSEKEYGFTHLSFQEYLSAEEIRNKGQIETLIKNYGDRWWKEVIRLSLALDNPSIIEEFMEQIIQTEDFEKEISLVIDALNDSIRKPSKPFIKAVSNDRFSLGTRSNAIRIMREMGGEKVIQSLAEIVNNSDKTLALLAYEALESLGVTEGVSKPDIEAAIGAFRNPADDSVMAHVPAGTFLYGSREDDENAHSDEKPQRVIDLPGFYIDTFPVTNEQYCKFLNERKPDNKMLEKWIDLTGGFEKEKCRIKKNERQYLVEKDYEGHPVIYVTWHGTDMYAQWCGNRLPTEKEWEKAARGTDGNNYPWGNKFDLKLCNSYESKNKGTTKVDTYPKGKSYYGCFDMVGNVWEWTGSWYDEDKDSKVLRGGSWNYRGYFCRCAGRGDLSPDDGSFIVGFRCARTL